LHGYYEKLSCQFSKKQEFEEFIGAEYNHQDQESVKKITHTKGNPSKQESLYAGYNRINSLAVIYFDPIRIPGDPLYQDGQYNQEYPTPAFHKTAK